jgi:hypothetical protein
MFLAFFYSEGLIYTHITPRDTRIIASYIVTAFSKFVTHLRKKHPGMMEHKRFFQSRMHLFTLPLWSRTGLSPRAFRCWFTLPLLT